MSAKVSPKKARSLSGELGLPSETPRSTPIAPDWERRRKPRISAPFPIKVRGVDASGKGFEIETVVENISSSGVYLRLPKQMSTGAKFNMAIRFNNADGSGPNAMLFCKVLRTELQPDELVGLAAAIERHKFL
jgi:hypothetical protein